MTKQKIQKEWERVRFETLENKPKIEGPYPPNVVRARELLLFAQVALAKVEESRDVDFHEELYRKTMNFYGF